MKEDLRGQVFGLLKVIDEAEPYVTPKGVKVRQWLCECECGAKVVTRGSALKSGHTKGCGQKHRAVKDMTGIQVYDLTVIERAPDYINADGTKHIMWRCRCSCGNESIVRGTALRNGSIRTCGCSRSKAMMGIGQDDLTGRVFGKWTVLYENGRLREPRGRLVPLWHCRCECGTERDIRAGTLKSGNSLSCGCFKYERLAERAAQGFGISHAEQVVNDYLSSVGLYYEPQKIYSDLRSKSDYPLSYDFLVYDKNGNPFFLIECQGVQHYKPIEYFGGERQFKIQQDNDARKRKYAGKLNLPLVEIPYTCRTDEDIVQLVKILIDTQEGSV